LLQQLLSLPSKEKEMLYSIKMKYCEEHLDLREMN